MCVVSKLAVWKGSLRPTGIDEANFAFLSGHVGGSGVQNPPIHVALKQFLLTMLGKQLMHFAHLRLYVPATVATLGIVVAALSSWTLPGLLEGI